MIPTNPTRPPVAPRTQEEQQTLFDYITVIMRRWKIFAVAFIVVFIGVALYTFLMKPVYEASSTLHVKDNKGKVGLLGELSLNPTNPVNAEIEILKSRTNAEQVVKQLHLDWRVSEKSDGLKFKILEFTSGAKEPIYRVKITGNDTYTVTKDDGGDIIGRGKAGVLLRKNNFSLLLSDLKGSVGDSFQLTLAPFNNVVAGLQNRIKAAEQGRQTGVIRVSYTSTNPVSARDIVNALVQAYLDQSIAFKSEEASRAVGFVEEQLQGLRGELDKSEQNLQTYKSTSGVIKLDSEAEELIRKIAEVEKQRAEIVLQQNQAKFALDSLAKARRTGTIYTPATMNTDPIIAGMAAKLADLEVQKKALLNDYTEEHPVVKNLQSQIEGLQKKMLDTYQTGLSNLARQGETISKQMAGYEGQMRSLPEAERDLARLTRLTKVSSDIYTFLLQKHEEVRIAKASTISNINVVDPAIIPGSPIKPKKAQNLLLGLIFGLGLGIGLAFFLEYMDDTIKNADEAKRIMNLPLLATIPHIPGREQKANGSAHHDNDMLITQREPKSAVAESFRALRTSLHFSAINKEKKIMLITSSFPSEGKSIVSSNLACIISQTGARVLIIDCDLRRSSLHKKFGHNKTPGLSEVLTGDVAFADARQNTDIEGLDLMTAGTTPPNPSELLGAEAMRRFLLEQRETYDYIIIDAPPILAVTDAPVLTTVSDVVVLVMEAGRVPIKVAQHMREILATLQAPVAGLVMNDKTRKGESYSYYGGRYYRYGKRYGYGYGYGYGYYSDDDKSKHKHHKKRHWWEKILPGKLRNIMK